MALNFPIHGIIYRADGTIVDNVGYYYVKGIFVKSENGNWRYWVTPALRVVDGAYSLNLGDPSWLGQSTDPSQGVWTVVAWKDIGSPARNPADVLNPLLEEYVNAPVFGYSERSGVPFILNMQMGLDGIPFNYYVAITPTPTGANGQYGGVVKIRKFGSVTARDSYHEENRRQVGYWPSHVQDTLGVITSLAPVGSNANVFSNGAALQYRHITSEPYSRTEFVIFQQTKIDNFRVDWDFPNGVYSYFYESDLGESATHQYSIVGEYTLSLVITDIQGQTSDNSTYNYPKTWTVRVTERPPVAGLLWNPPNPERDELITFTPDITDLDGSFTSVDYYIEGVLTHTGLGINDTFQAQFSSLGNKIIRQVIHWFDAYINDTVDTNFTVTVVNSSPVASFVSSSIDTSSRTITWSSTSTDADGTIDNYRWRLYDAGMNLIEERNGAAYNQYTRAFTSDGIYTIRLTVTDNEGGTNTAEDTFVVVVTPGGGGTTIVLPIPSE